MVLLVPALLVLFTSVQAPLPGGRPRGGHAASRSTSANLQAAARPAAGPRLERDHPQGDAVRHEDLARGLRPAHRRRRERDGGPRGRLEDAASSSRRRRRGLPPPKLIVVYSPYRRLYAPLKEVVTDLQHAHPDRDIAVIIPELIGNRWYHYLLHNQTAAS